MTTILTIIGSIWLTGAAIAFFLFLSQVVRELYKHRKHKTNEPLRNLQIKNECLKRQLDAEIELQLKGVTRNA